MSNFTYSDNIVHAAVVVGSGGGKTKKKEKPASNPVQKPKPKIDLSFREPEAKEEKPTETGIKGKLSKYFGGFIRKGNRMNNSKAYNHDYYTKNKEKWNRSKLGMTLFLPRDLTNKWLKTIGSFMLDSMKKVGNWLSGNYVTVESQVNRLINKNGMKKAKDVPVRMEHKYLYKVYKDGRWRYFYSDSEYHSFLNRVKRIEGEHSYLDDSREVNPNYGEDYLYSINCSTCSVMYDLRRRGYDVSAMDHYGTQDDGGMMSWQLEDLYEGNGERASGNFVEPRGIEYSEYPYSAEGYEISKNNCKKLYDELSTYEDGARGIMVMYWQSGGGHAISWEVVNGKAVIIDSQSNRVFTDYESFADNYGKDIMWGVKSPTNGNQINDINEKNGVDTDPSDQSRYEMIHGFQYMRTDNAKPSEKILKGAEYQETDPVANVTEEDYVYEVAQNPNGTKRHYNK